MSTEVMIFWLCHLFLGIVLPILVYTGCCRNELEEERERAAAAKS
jgi:hypothetical protein